MITTPGMYSWLRRFLLFRIQASWLQSLWKHVKTLELKLWTKFLELIAAMYMRGKLSIMLAM